MNELCDILKELAERVDELEDRLENAEWEIRDLQQAAENPPS